MKVPKCISWLGHRFEARYSTGPGRHLSDQELYWTPSNDILRAIQAAQTRTYVCDVCTRCGCTVNKMETDA